MPTLPSQIMADVTIEEAAKEDWDDLIALPRGLPGANDLRDCQKLIELLKKEQETKLYSAVCASLAVVLTFHNLIGAGATCYPEPLFCGVITDASDEKVVALFNDMLNVAEGRPQLFNRVGKEDKRRGQMSRRFYGKYEEQTN